MILKSLKVRRMHGSLNLDVNFNPEITLLIGINGSGKTSVLNVIDWLLKPNLQQLALTDFSELTLAFSSSSRDYLIQATRTTKLVTLKLAGSATPVAPITVNLISAKANSDEAAERYSGLTPEPHEMPMWDLLRSFAKPTVITLDRTISAEADDVRYFEVEHRPPPRIARGHSPIGHVQDVLRKKYALYRAKYDQYDNELKTSIVMSALQDPVTLFNRESVKLISEAEIAKLEEKFIRYFSSTATASNFSAQVANFFKSSRALTEQSVVTKDPNSPLMNFFLSQYRQIENLATAFNEFETKTALAFKELKGYLDTVNGFLADSNKVLSFEATGRLVFNFVNTTSRDRKRPENRTIGNLSSGERQILILFTFLAFVAVEKGVFIVDEPELSLHPKWQHQFMEAFLKLRPIGTQILLATHSPDIVGSYKSVCVPLRSAPNA